MDNKVNLEGILLNYYIKYDRLNILNSQIANPPRKVEYIDIYIDLYDMLKNVYSQDVYATKKLLIVSSIINLAAHLRGYYKRAYRLWSRIFLVYGEESTNSHRNFIPEFTTNNRIDALNYEKTNAFIDSQLKVLNILCAYIYDIYYIRKHCDFSVFTYDNIQKNNSPMNIIITKSTYAYQIPALSNDNTPVYIFRPKKYKYDDTSYLINKPLVLQAYFNTLHRDNILNMIKDINPELLSVLMSISGNKYKYVKPLTSATKAIYAIHNLISNGRILNQYNSDPELIYNAIMETDLRSIINSLEFINRFKGLDLIYQHLIYINTAESMDNSWYINLEDVNTFQNINNKYFIDNPLDLNNL